MIDWSVNGISRAEADGRYVRRFVGATLTADTYTGVASAGSETVLNNPNGPVMGLVPADAPPFLLESGDGGRFGNRLKIIRAGAATLFRGTRFNGSYAAPTGVLANENVISIEGGAVIDAGNVTATIARIDIFARENITATAQGGAGRLLARDLGGTTERTVVLWRSGGVGIGEFLGVQTATRYVPAGAGTLQIRNAANTANVIEVGASTLGFFNVAPIVRPTITGSRAGNAAVASIAAQLALLGLVIDGTTP